jgi:hypothetical protein
MTITYVGVDPGITGAVAWISGRDYGVFDLPTMTASDNGKVRWMVDGAELAYLLTANVPKPPPSNEVRAALEQTSAMPGQGVASMFSMGHSFGACHGVLGTLGYDLTLVRPAQWKKDLGIGRKKGEDADVGKAKSMSLARKHFPKAPLERIKDHNRAEALLLAHWMKTKEQ